MKRLIFCLFCFLTAGGAKAQEVGNEVGAYDFVCDDGDDDGWDVFVVVEEMPAFPYGDVEDWLADEVEKLFRRTTGWKLSEFGKAYVSFIVEEDGSLSGIEPIGVRSPRAQQEAVRIVESMPKWIPGRQAGRLVRVSKTLQLKITPEGALKYHRDGDAVYMMNGVSKVYLTTEEMPVFPEGDFRRWVARHVAYPVKAMERGVEGKVYVEFVVNGKGWVTDVNAGTYGDVLLRKEAERVCSEMPQWMAGRHNGEAVNVRMWIPILFQLDKGEKEVVEEEPDIFSDGQVMPKFTEGGVAEWVKERVRELFLRTTGWKLHEFGKVFLSFTIEKDGSVTNVKVLRGIGGRADLEAVRIVEMMPKWIPGSIAGKPKSTMYILPVKIVP